MISWLGRESERGHDFTASTDMYTPYIHSIYYSFLKAFMSANWDSKDVPVLFKLPDQTKSNML